jgi:hypothetical protein
MQGIRLATSARFTPVGFSAFFLFTMRGLLFIWHWR